MTRLRPNISALVILSATLLCGLFSAPSSVGQQDRQLVQTGSTATTTAKRIALVIGNGAYTTAPALKNPPNDAREMAATLKTLGFEVSSGINVSQREMKRLIREFGQKLKAGGNGLFYYAGHGVQARGRNYIIPVDADIQSEADVEDSGVDVGLMLNYMDDAQNGLNIVILDACRNNPFSRSFRSASEGLAQVDAPTGTLIAYATAPGRVAADGAGENGLYTSELLKAMRRPGLTATDMFMQVRGEVMKRTGNKQVPWEASSLVGAFYFSGGPTNLSLSNSAANNAAPSEPRFDAAAFEYSFWETIKNSTNADDFKAYLAKYPNGQFIDLAKNRIKNLEVATKPAEPKNRLGPMEAFTERNAPVKTFSVDFLSKKGNSDWTLNNHYTMYIYTKWWTALQPKSEWKDYTEEQFKGSFRDIYSKSCERIFRLDGDSLIFVDNETDWKIRFQSALQATEALEKLQQCKANQP